MILSREAARRVYLGKQTQTKVIMKPGESGLSLRDPGYQYVMKPFSPGNTGHGIKWMVGKSYAICPPGREAWCQVRITAIRLEKLGEIGPEAALREGFATPEKFLDHWRGKVGKQVNLMSVSAWVLTFERV